MERESYKNESPGTILARDAGLNDEQIKAMNGMQDIVPRTVFPRLKNKSPEEIEDVMQRYAQIFIAETQILTEALNGENDLLPEINRRRIADELGRNVESGIIQNPSPESPRPDNNI